MNKQKIVDAMNETVSNILEQTAFVFPEPVDMTAGISFEDFENILVTLDFSGDKTGKIKMIIPVEFCAELSANLLGEDIGDVDPEENNFDSAKELLNIISGQLLVNLYSDKALFSLSNLEVSKLEEAAFSDVIENGEYFCCKVDDYPILTIINIQEKVDEHKSVGSR